MKRAFVILTLIGLAVGPFVPAPFVKAQDPAEAARRAEAARQREASELLRKDYQALLESLLKSGDEKTVRLGLQHLFKCEAHGFQPYSVAIHNELLKLTDSENREIRDAAVLAVMRVAPEQAAEHGFQGPGRPWRPVREDVESERTRKRLEATVGLRGKYTPQKLALELRDQDVDLRFHPDIAADAIDVDCAGFTLREALTRIFEPRDLNYWIEGRHILVAPATFKRSHPVHVYHIRGLLNDALTMERVVQLVEKSVSGDKQPATVEALDGHRISVQGSEFQHHRIAVYLSTLAPERKSEF